MTSKFLYALCLSLSLPLTAAAQTRGGARNTGGAPARTAVKPSPTPAPTPVSAAAQPKVDSSINPEFAAVAKACGCEDARLPAVLAVVNGVKFTQADLSPETQRGVAQLQQQVVEARKRELDLQINNILLEAEAKKRGVSSTKLLEDEVVAKTVNPTEADAQNYFNQNKSRIEAQAGRAVQFAEIKDQVVAFVRGERQQERARQFAETLRAANSVKVLVPEATPPAAPADRSRVLATVNGRNITSGDIEDGLRPLVHSVQVNVYDLRRRDLNMKINDMLLSEEARRRQLTARALLEAEVVSKVPVVTEAEAQKFYDENKARINSEFAQVKYQIIQYLQEEQQEKAEGAFAERLRKAASVQTFLNAPEPPVFQIATDDQPAKGNPAAAVTVVEFTDYQCPSCAQTYPLLERLLGEYGDRVRLVVRDFPLAQHADALKAAEAAEAAREQGKYWDYVAILYRNQSALGVEHLKQYATALGLDRAKFDAALDGGKFAEQVRRDIFDGQKVGVTGTPSIFVNGRPVSEITYEALKASVESALKAAQR